MAQLRLRTFGGISVENSGHTLGPAAGQPKRLALLALIAEPGARGISRDQLVACLWPESDTAHARNALNQAVHNLRRDLLAEAVVEGGHTLRLNPNVISSDIAEFEAASSACDLSCAVELYKGPFLDGFHLRETPEFERWVEVKRAEKRDLVIAAARCLAERAHTSNELESAERWARRGLTIDPYDETVLRRLLEILRDRGDQAGAARAYQEFARGLELDLGGTPSVETRGLLARLSADARSTAAEPAGPRSTHIDNGGVEKPQSSAAVTVPDRTIRNIRRPRRPVLLLWSAVGLALVALTGGLIWRGKGQTTAGPDAAPVVVAIRPFENLGPDTGRAYLSAGTTDQVALYLSRIDGIKVASPAAVAEQMGAKKTIRQMADALKASALVSGSVSVSGDRLRIIAQVDDPRTGRRLWAENYDRTMKDVFAVQGEIALSIAQTLGKRLTPEEQKKVATPQTTSLEADALRRRARSLLQPVPDVGRVDAAFGLLRRAVALDPQFADAYNDLAAAFMWTNYLIGKEELLDSIVAYSGHALELGLDRSGQADAYRLSALAYDDSFQYQKAIELNRRSLSVRPGGFWETQGIAFDFLVLGRADSAYPWIQRAYTLRPDRITPQLSLGWAFVTSDSLPAAEAQIQETIRRFPEEFASYSALARFHLLRGDPQEALSVLRVPMTPAPGRRFTGEPRVVLGAAIAASLHLGNYRQVEQLYRRLLREDPPAEDSLGRPSPDEWTCHRVGTDWAFARWVGRQDRKGRELLEQIKARDLKRITKGAVDPCFPYEVGAISAALGNSTESLRYLRDAAGAGWRHYRYARYDPLLQSVRTNPDFESLLTSVAESAAAVRKRIVSMRP